MTFPIADRAQAHARKNDRSEISCPAHIGAKRLGRSRPEAAIALA
jgi:hypothetical protein